MAIEYRVKELEGKNITLQENDFELALITDEGPITLVLPYYLAQELKGLLIRTVSDLRYGVRIP